MKSVFVVGFDLARDRYLSSCRAVAEILGTCIIEDLQVMSFVIPEHDPVQGKPELLRAVCTEKPDAVLIFCMHPQFCNVTVQRTLFSPQHEMQMSIEDRILSRGGYAPDFHETINGVGVIQALTKAQIPAMRARIDQVSHICSDTAYLVASAIGGSGLSTKIGLIILPPSDAEIGLDPHCQHAVPLPIKMLVHAGIIACTVSVTEEVPF